MWYAPLRHDGATGPTIFSLLTTPSPTAAAILASSWAWTIRSWVAHAVDSADTVRTPSLSVVGVACAAICSPTTAGHRPNTDASATRPDHPRVFARSLVTAPNSCGSRPSGPGPDHRRRLVPATRRDDDPRPRPTSFPCVRAAPR